MGKSCHCDRLIGASSAGGGRRGVAFAVGGRMLYLRIMDLCVRRVVEFILESTL